MAANRIGGTAYFKIDGAQYSLKGKAEVMPLTTNKTGVVGLDGPHGFTEKPKLPGFKMTISDLGAVSISALQDLEGAVITLECNNGKTWILTDGWVEGDITNNAEDGTFDAEFRGMAMNEQVAS